MSSPQYFYLICTVASDTNQGVVMARNKNRAKRDLQLDNRGVSRIHDPTRDILHIATQSVRLGEPEKRTRLHLPYNPLLGLREVEDRRTYPYEVRERIYRHIDGTPARITKQPSRKRPLSWMPSGMHDTFQQPERVSVCVRRKARKRVLFALQKTGKGSGAKRTARWTAKSFIRCK